VNRVQTLISKPTKILNFIRGVREKSGVQKEIPQNFCYDLLESFSPILDDLLIYDGP
jgi:hypothetical protein